MHKIKFISCLLLVLILSDFTYAQRRRYKVAKKNGITWEMNFGATNMLGDLGGADKIGAKGLQDLDFPASRYCAGGGIVLNGLKPIDFRFNTAYLRLNGSDTYTENEARKIRNITVNTDVFLFNALIEVKMPLSSRGTFGSGSHICLNAGIGGFYFNPKATYNGQSYGLSKLKTEGQGSSNDRPIYSQLVLDVPFGIAYRYYMTKYSSYGFELMAHKSFTDYLDDVSTTYYDNETIRINNGEAAAYLADPNTTGIKRTAGSKRGNPKQNDNFFTVSFTYRYTIHSSRLF